MASTPSWWCWRYRAACGASTRDEVLACTLPTDCGPAARCVDGACQASTPPRHRLNPALTFDTLVAGRANQMARTAALHVAGAPGVMYNPLFIYGGVGLGKTHLIHAVGNALLKDRPDARVLYLHAEQFISDVVKNYQRKTFDELKAKYHSLDLLLIDDVQFFAGKDRTQEEFFNAFEALLAKKAHIIMTSDTYPKGLVDIDERLTSRFDAGLTVAIEPPELEMRVAILMKKAVAEGSPMPEDVAFFIAKNVRANVRELEGALRKVLAYSRFSHKDINIALAREALKDLLSIQNRQIGVENIQKTVADFYKIKVADMYSKKRPVSIARPRLAVLGLNPHSGEGGLFGDEEARQIAPAVAAAQALGIDASGPHSADTLFHFAVQGHYDAVIAMYHDQGLGPLKLLHFEDAVNVTLGLPIVRTSVDHGTAYDLAGTGKASERSLVAAVRIAEQMTMTKKP